MEYWKVIWHHVFAREPVVIFNEIGEGGYETRKVQEYRNGRLLRTDGTDETDEIGLGEIPVGNIEDVAAQAEFSAIIISAEQFNAVWDLAVSAG